MTSLFVHPWMLAALAAIILPPLIEWLFRRRKRRIELPTLRFLLDNQEQKKVRRQDRLLLLLRMAAILLLVIAISRPLWTQGLLDGNRQRNVILLLDGTASMSQQLEVSTSFALAQKKAAAVVRSLPEGASVTVASFSDRVSPVIENETDLHTAAARIESLQAGCGAAPIASAIGWVRDFVAKQKIESAELYIFSDFQKYTWQRDLGKASGMAVADTSRALHEAGNVCETFFIDVGGQPQFNLIVTHLQPVEYVMSAGMPVKFQAAVETRGSAPADARATATFLVDGVKKDVRELSLTSSGGAAISFDYVFPKAGEYLVEVVVDGDRHRIDNRRQYLCLVPENARVLVVDDSVDTAMPMSSFLSRAIRPPTHPGVDKLSHFDAKVVHPSRLSYENLSDYVVVILAGTSQVNEALAAQLERFVADGGALWFFLGDAVNSYDYQRLFFKEGHGLLPCSLGTVENLQAADGGAQPVTLLYGEATHAALAQLARTAGSTDLQIRRRMKLELGGLPESGVLVRFSDGVPALVEKSQGRGRVLLANLSIGPQWSYLPALAEFPVLVHGVLSYLVGQPDRAVNLNVGERFEQTVFVSTQHLLLRTPEGAPVRLTPQRDPDRDGDFRVSFADTSQPGLYEIDAPEEVLSRRRFVVNHDATEGELDRFAAADVAELFPVPRGGWIGPETALDQFAAQLHTVTELAPWTLALLASVLAVESLCAWRFGRRRGGSIPT